MTELALARFVEDPAAIALGRMPMAPGLDPYDDIESAVAGDASPWVRSLDGVWRFRLQRRPWRA